jgi:hypothetical protein
MSKRPLKDRLEDYYPDHFFVLATGLDDAFLGISWKNVDRPVLVYDIDRAIKALMESNGWAVEHAFEYLEYNMIDVSSGVQDPLFVESIEWRE